jgi:hypothetical protein
MLKRFSFFFFLLPIVFCFNSNAGTIILTHGAFGQDQEWYQPDGYFYDALDQEAKLFGYDVLSFSWDQFLGGITHKERLRAGRALAKLVVDLGNEGETDIIFIGHSYGGHILKVASQILAVGLGLKDEREPIIVLLERGMQITEEEQALFEEICKEFKELEDTKKFKDIFYKKKEKNLFYNSMGRPGDFLIDHAYILGTPNNIPDYVANMDIIGSLYNFYSKGDWVQEVVGDRLLPEPKHEYAVNLEIRIKSGGFFNFITCHKPSHMDMHAKIIGTWILYIPYFLKSESIGNFEMFTFDYDGKIRLSEKKPPIYTCKNIGLKKLSFFQKINWTWFKENIPFFK